METEKCPLCGADVDSSEMSSFVKRFWEIMNQVDTINQKEQKIDNLLGLSDEEFNRFMTSDRIEVIKSLIDRHNKISL